ncbi:MAG: hypothetical protein HQL08_06880 [Nitrospirae bacterium]|nr:hypothetical protein [Nitrospirota bacterium]
MCCVVLSGLLLLVSQASFAADVCAGKKPGSITFFDQEISRDTPLPKPVTTLNFSKPMFALICMTDSAGPQSSGGKKFRVVLYVKQVNLPAGKYSSYKQAKQEGGIFRPQLSVARKDVIVAINEDFDFTGLAAKLDPGEYEFRLQAASEKGTGKLDVTVDWSNDVAYIQELRKAGYLADGTIKVVK